MSSKKNSDKETFSLPKTGNVAFSCPRWLSYISMPKTVSLFGTQKALQKLVDMRGEKQYNEANKEWLLTPITLAEGGLRKCGYFMQ